eukprot:365531-Chlamydomonas_euryale.AAC.1
MAPVTHRRACCAVDRCADDRPGGGRRAVPAATGRPRAPSAHLPAVGAASGRALPRPHDYPLRAPL